jgi:hypothetical protein
LRQSAFEAAPPLATRRTDTLDTRIRAKPFGFVPSHQQAGFVISRPD